MPKFYLASKSPRRSDLLSMVGADFEVISSDANEDIEALSPDETVRILSVRKAEGALSYRKDENALIIASDTVVSLDGVIFGKPKDRADAKRMIESLSGRAHRVLSGIALIRGGERAVGHSETFVYMDEIDAEDLSRYLDTPEAYDKAGAYGIQGYASRWISRIDGCYFGVVGMSVNTLDKLHRELTGAPIK